MSLSAFRETLSITLKFLLLPLYVIPIYIKHVLVKGRNGHVFLRSVVRTPNASLSMAQMAMIAPPTSQVYDSWIKSRRMEAVKDDLVDGAGLYWIGSKGSKNVILYVHGGGFFTPLTPHALHFLDYLRLQLAQEGVDASVAVLQYSLAPAKFPTQLRQICVAVDHLIATGTDPGRIQLIGDSAGGNLILQLVSQLLHPISRDLGPILPLKRPFAGIFLASPWVVFESDSPSFIKADGIDIFDQRVLKNVGQAYNNGTNASPQRPYFEPAYANDAWFNDLSRVTSRILVSAGDDELLRDDIVEFTDKHLRREGVDVRLDVQQHGVHIDPFLDFFFSDKPTVVGSSTPGIVAWLREGFTGSH